MAESTNKGKPRTTSRPSIDLDDRQALLDRFNVGNVPKISFVVIAHRCVEALDALIDADETGVMERLTQKWATDEANQEHQGECSLAR